MKTHRKQTTKQQEQRAATVMDDIIRDGIADARRALARTAAKQRRGQR